MRLVLLALAALHPACGGFVPRPLPTLRHPPRPSRCAALPDAGNRRFAPLMAEGRAPPPRLPEHFVAACAALCLLAMPMAHMGISLINPVATQRFVEARAEKVNNEVLDATWELVVGQSYSEGVGAWVDRFDDALASINLRTILRSDEAMDSTLNELVGALRDPYAAYASRELLAAGPAETTYGVQLEPKGSERAKQQQRSAVFPSSTSALLVRGVMPDSPAEAAGLLAGDYISSADGATADALREALRGRLSAVGADAGKDAVDSSATTEPQTDAPAADASGDAVLASARLRAGLGPEGGDLDDLPALELDVWRDGRTEPARVSLFAQATPPSPVHARLLDGPDGRAVAYVRLNLFNEEATASLVGAVAEFERSGHVAGYVLDLRNSPGGMVREAMHDAALLLSRDSTAVVAHTRDANGALVTHDVRSILARTATEGTESADTADDALVTRAPRVDPAESSASAPSASHSMVDEGVGGASFADKRVIVLVNHGTASSAELFAAALHDNERALLMGESTYGKGLIQRVFPLANGGALKLTIGEFLRPNQKGLTHGVGIQPDRTCEATPMLLGANVDACVERAAWLAADSIH